MKIPFWSHLHGQPGTTTNLSAVATVATLNKNVKSLLLQTHYSLNNLERSLIGYQRDKESLIDVGIDELARSPKLSKLDENAIYNCSISAIHDKMYLLPGTTKADREDFERNTGSKVKRIIAAAEKYYDTVFIDTNAGNGSLAMEILNTSDLIVVNLTQNVPMIERFFSDYNFENKNVVYLIGDYEKNSHYNLYNLKKRFEQLRINKVAVIPHCIEFKDAQSDENALQFIKKNIDCTRGKNEYFIRCVKEAADIILEAGKEGGKAV